MTLYSFDNYITNHAIYLMWYFIMFGMIFGSFFELFKYTTLKIKISNHYYFQLYQYNIT